jgi:hypothetical protein
VVASEEFDTSLGKSALLTKTKEDSQLWRWRFEKPSAPDEQSAKEWRQAVSSVDLEKAKAQLKSSNPEMPRVKSLPELGPVVDIMLRLGDQRILLEMCLEDAHLDDGSREEIRTRWERAQAPTLWSFAPYAFFCFRIRMLFHVGLVNDLVTTKSSNTADLVYLYYAPFCKVFSSNDTLHEDLAPMVLRPDQFFVQTRSLRSDLDAIDNFWKQLSLQQQRMWFDRFGHWPPRNTASFTYRTWSRTMALPAGLRRGNALKNMLPEARKKMDEHVREVMQQFTEIQEQIKARKTENNIS